MSTLIERLMNVVHPVAPVPTAPTAVSVPAPFPVSSSLGSGAEWTSPYPAGYTIAINRVLGLEGGYTPGLAGDPGGETNWGISKHSFPNIDIKNLTRAGAIQIYYSSFWTAINAEKMAPALAYQALDFAVNSGPETSIRKLQVALGVADDGQWGAVTQAASDAAPVAKVIKRFLAERLDFMRSLSNWPNFSKDWAGRIATDLRYGALDA